MSRHGLLMLILRIVVAVVVVLVLVRVISYYTSTTTTDFCVHSNLSHVQRVQPDEVRQIWIYAGFYASHGRQAMSAMLSGAGDRKDVARLLAAVKNIHVSDRAMRVPAIQERIFIHAQKTKITIYGYFDPRRAPVISPTMRSDDLSRIVQDILKRKGKRDAPTH